MDAKIFCGRVKLLGNTWKLPPKTEAEIIDGELLFFLPDGSLWVYDGDLEEIADDAMIVKHTWQ